MSDQVKITNFVADAIREHLRDNFDGNAYMIAAVAIEAYETAIRQVTNGIHDEVWSELDILEPES